MAAFVIDPPEREPRRYQREWGAERWRGTLDEIIEAVEAALEEVKKQGPAEPRPSATFVYKDGSSETVNGLGVLKEAASQADPSEVKDLSVKLDGPPSFELTGTPGGGLAVSAEGTHAFAVGMVGMLSFHLARGEEAGKATAEPSVRPIEWFFIALAPFFFVGAFLAAALHFGVDSVEDGIAFSVMSLAVGAIPILILVGIMMEHAFQPGPPRFVLVREGEQEQTPTRRGPIWATRAWFKSHPALAFLVTIVISGLVGAVIAKGIDAV
jgi:hypothetical protein